MFRSNSIPTYNGTRPASSKAYDQGFDDGYFKHYKRYDKDHLETAAYEAGFNDGVACRPAAEREGDAKPKPRAKKAESKAT
jgi:hypothetical protein